jgi:hypothetical protein
MPNETALTTFLVELVVNQQTRDDFEKNRAKTLSQFGLSPDTKTALLKPNRNTVRKLIENQQTATPVEDAMALLRFAVKTSSKAKRSRITRRRGKSGKKK